MPRSGSDRNAFPEPSLVLTGSGCPIVDGKSLDEAVLGTGSRETTERDALKRRE